MFVLFNRWESGRAPHGGTHTYSGMGGGMQSHSATKRKEKWSENRMNIGWKQQNKNLNRTHTHMRVASDGLLCAYWLSRLYTNFPSIQIRQSWVNKEKKRKTSGNSQENKSDEYRIIYSKLRARLTVACYRWWWRPTRNTLRATQIPLESQCKKLSENLKLAPFPHPFNEVNLSRW